LVEYFQKESAMIFRTKIIIILIAVLLVLAFAYSIFFVTPSKSDFELRHSEIAAEIQLGEEVEVHASLANKQFFVHRMIYSANWINFVLRKADETEELISTKEAKSGLFLMLETKTRTIKFKPTEKGDYIIDIYSSFTINGTDYFYKDKIFFSVR